MAHPELEFFNGLSGTPEIDGSEWLGGVDAHHVFFEGIHPGEDGVWEIYWGS